MLITQQIKFDQQRLNNETLNHHTFTRGHCILLLDLLERAYCSASGHTNGDEQNHTHRKGDQPMNNHDGEPIKDETDAFGYPIDWPKCPGCGLPALDGHITCGNVECDEGGRR